MSEVEIGPGAVELHLVREGDSDTSLSACLRVLRFLLSSASANAVAEDVHRARRLFDAAIQVYLSTTKRETSRRRRKRSTGRIFSDQADYMNDFYSETPSINDTRWHNLTESEKKQVLDLEAEMFSRSLESLPVRLALAARLQATLREPQNSHT